MLNKTEVFMLIDFIILHYYKWHHRGCFIWFPWGTDNPISGVVKTMKNVI